MNVYRRLWLVVPLFAWLLVYTLSTAPLAGSAESQLLVVRIQATTAAERLRLAQSDLDLLETHDGNDLFAIVSPARRAQLSADGWNVRIDDAQTAMLASQAHSARIAGISGYRTIPQIYALLNELSTSYPQLVTLVDYGDSLRKVTGEGGHDLLALRLTNAAVPGPKPVFVLIAAIHAREIATDEIALRFVRHLLTGYGNDPEATWLLNEHEIIVLPLTNPDGRQIVDELALLHRKNTRPTGSCIGEYIFSHNGVDLNRNSSFRWGTVDSINNTGVCDARYPGLNPASEPETAALEAFVRSVLADQRGPNDQDTAPASASGIFISLHSYGNLVLWPWGDPRFGIAPNDTELGRLGRRMARFNGYQPTQSYNLYPTSGTTDEWAYGELGVAAYTFEIGPNDGRCGGFFPIYECIEGLREEGGELWARNLPALLYAAKVARAPYALPAGPDVVGISATDAGSVTLTATLSSNGGSLSAAEMYLDAPPWRGGTPLALSAADGTFDSETETALLTLPATSGRVRQLALVRARSGEAWGPFSAAFVTVPQERPANLWLPLTTR